MTESEICFRKIDKKLRTKNSDQDQVIVHHDYLGNFTGRTKF